MLVTRKSVLTKKKHTRDIPITQEEYYECASKDWRNVDTLLPHLSSEDREFLSSGTTKDEWVDVEDGIFGEY